MKEGGNEVDFKIKGFKKNRLKASRILHSERQGLEWVLEGQHLALCPLDWQNGTIFQTSIEVPENHRHFVQGRTLVLGSLVPLQGVQEGCGISPSYTDRFNVFNL